MTAQVTPSEVQALLAQLQARTPALASLKRLSVAPGSSLIFDVETTDGLRAHVEVTVQADHG